MNPDLKLYKFSDFTLNPIKKVLLQNDAEIKLNGKSFDVLLLLIENAPGFCSVDEIIRAVWKETFVSNNSVEKIITGLRKALGDDKSHPRFIRTERGTGYSFIGEVTVERKLPEPEAKFLTEAPQPEPVQPAASPVRSRLKFKLAAAGAGLLAVVLIGGFLLRTGQTLAKFNRTIILADDFSSGQIDPERWMTKGKTARVSDGVLKLSVDETDNPPNFSSQYLTVDPSKLITVECRLKVSFSRNMKDRAYFGGHFVIVPKIRDFQENSFLNNDRSPDLYSFGVRYMNYDSREIFLGDSGESIQEIPTEGFFLVREGGRPNVKPDYAAAKIAERIEPVWAEWFKQKLIYNPVDGQMTYFINDEKKGEFNAGVLRAKDNQIRLFINPWGWWVNHSMEIDEIEISQQ